MRGIGDPRAYEDLVQAVLGFPPTPRRGKTATEVFQNSYKLLSDLVAGYPNYHRARGWKAYALALSVYESWPLPNGVPEANMTWQKRLEEAEKLACKAAEDAPNDFDVHWALADVYLICGNFAKCRVEFERALVLNGDERHPNLFAEAASAMMQMGRHEEAEDLFRKAARRPDWHRWMRGIHLLLRAGRSAAERRALLDQALDELKATHVQPGQDFYQEELQLVIAAVYWRKAQLIDAKVKRAAAAARPSLTRNSAHNWEEARRAAKRFRDVRNWTLNQAQSALKLNATDQEYWNETMQGLWQLSDEPRKRKQKQKRKRKQKQKR